MPQGSRSWRQDARRLQRLFRRAQPTPPAAPIPPALPPGRVLAVAGQGETFVRLTDPVAGTTPVLLLHGWAATADLNWWRTYEPLAKDRQVIAPDHQGHGRGLRTEAPFTLERCADLAAGVLDALGIPSAVVVGYSMGGPIALRLWERHPHHVAALVLGATALTFNERWYDRMTWRVVAVLEWLLRATGDRWFVRRIVREVIEQDTSMEPLRGWLFGELERGNARDLHDAGVALSRFDGSGLVAPTDIPRAVIITEQDRLVPPPRQHALAQALRASEHPIPADHDVPMVRPRVFLDALRSALAAVDAELSSVAVRETT